MIITVYIVVLALVILAYMLTVNYASDRRKQLGLYGGIKNSLNGLCMFVVDMLFRFKLIDRECKMSVTLREIYIKDKVDDIKYVYIVRKTSISICVFAGIVIVGLIASACAKDTKDYIDKIDRPAYGESTEKVNIVVRDEAETKDINLVISEKKISEEEAYKIVSDEYKKVIKIMMNGNEDKKHITKDLVFPETSGDKNIELSWEPKDTKCIDYDGKIFRGDQSKSTDVKLTMSFEKISKSYDIHFTILPKEQKGSTIQDKIQKYIDKEDSYSKDVSLPKSIDGKNLSYYNSDNSLPVPYILLGIIFSVVIFIFKDKDIKDKSKERYKQLELDYSQIVSKLMLLTNAGLTIKQAWMRMISDYENSDMTRYLYEEMKLTANKMNSGLSEGEAYREFGRRCNLHGYIKLGSLLEQSIRMGSKGMKEMLDYEVHEAFAQRKVIAKKNGDDAGTKMLFPMIIMLVLSIVIIMVPSFLSMGGM